MLFCPAYCQWVCGVHERYEIAAYDIIVISYFCYMACNVILQDQVKHQRLLHQFMLLPL